MKILITGHKGYIGSHLVKLLKQHGHYVIGCDLHLFKEAEVNEQQPPDEEWIKDFRSISSKDLLNIDVVCHLAAISNDAMGELDPSLTRTVNYTGSVNLAESAKDAGVRRFIFSSSCSIYGKGTECEVNEESELNPLTEYARSKIETEHDLRKLACKSFTPFLLRNATAYGASPVFRTDLVVNNLFGSALAYNQILIKSDGAPWRPLIHCFDIAIAFQYFAELPENQISETVLNIGHNNGNYQVREIADHVNSMLPDCKIVYTGEIGSDPRDYKVSFDRLRNSYPSLELKYSLENGMKDLLSFMQAMNFNQDVFESDRFTRLKLLKKQLHLFN